jgi:hypothetical protein
VLAAFVAACGIEPSTTLPVTFASGGAVPMRALMPETTFVKVAVKTTQVVYTPVLVDDGDQGTPVPCATDAACSEYQGASCQNGNCATASNVYGMFYVTNFDKGAQTDIRLPCDGKQYTAEVYGAIKGSNLIQESWVSAPITPPASSTGCTIDPPTWTAFTNPGFDFPTIYVGLPAPYDKYTITVKGLQYPWAASDWAATCNGATPAATTPRAATFAAPKTVDPIICSATFHLDKSLLASGETWVLQYASPAQTPVPSGGAGFPP